MYFNMILSCDCIIYQVSLTHISQTSFCGTEASSTGPDQTPQNVASDQGLHYLLAECSIKIE